MCDTIDYQKGADVDEGVDPGLCEGGRVVLVLLEGQLCYVNVQYACQQLAGIDECDDHNLHGGGGAVLVYQEH